MALALTVVFTFSGTASAASTTPAGAGRVTATGGLNVRTRASQSSTRLSSLKSNSYVMLINKEGNWWYVEYADGKFGYCSADYIETASSNVKSVSTESGRLRVRSGAGTNYSAVTSLSSGEKVAVLSTTGGWSKILYNGIHVGYVSSSYLKSGETSETYSSVSLSVPRYSQTDSRWSSIKMGNSNATIGRSGCLLTSFAMTESYRTGTTITPAAMEKKSSFTSSGAIYWPSNYTADYSTDYLKNVYNYLKAGKPVIIGGTDSYGRTHWVVITGFKGGTSLTNASFTVNDPGSSTVTTLAQFRAKYPKHIRLMYYK